MRSRERAVSVIHIMQEEGWGPRSTASDWDWWNSERLEPSPQPHRGKHPGGWVKGRKKVEPVMFYGRAAFWKTSQDSGLSTIQTIFFPLEEM